VVGVQTIFEPTRRDEIVSDNPLLESHEYELRWRTVTLNEVLKQGKRLDASVFGIEGKHAREILKQCKWPLTTITGPSGLANAFYPTRFKRILVEESDYPLFLPSQIKEIKPKPKGFLSPLCKTDFRALEVKKGQILLTRSGTIGNCSFVGKILDCQTMSDDIIRITSKRDIDAGYLYAFLCTKIGNALIRTNEYGAVVSHIEPEHLDDLPIPNPPEALKRQIHDLVVRSYSLRDESNDLLDQAETMLYNALCLPPVEELVPHYFDQCDKLRNYTVNLSDLAGRLDGSYHIPLVDTILRQLEKGAKEITRIGDTRISKRIILPGRFTRVFVPEGQGAVYFTGKHILELDPSNKKYLAFAKHRTRIREELTIRKNMLLVTCSGTLGKVVLVPQHWDGWTMTHDIIRLVPPSEEIAGYIWVFLASPYGQELIRRFTYGSVVDHIEAEHIVQVAVPLLKDVTTQAKINQLAVEANAKRTEAYYAEQAAIRIINEEVIYATS